MAAKLHAVHSSSRSRSRSRERQALADAIERRAKAQQDLEDARGRLVSTQGAIEETERSLEDARKAVASQKRLAAENIARNGKASIDIKSARARETDAADVLDAARAALGTVQKEIADAEHALAQTDDAIDVAVINVVRADVDAAQILADTEVLQNTLLERRIALRYLLHDHLIGNDEVAAAVKSFLMDVADKLPGTYGMSSYVDWAKHEANEPWTEAVVALRTNADAELPS
jgi:chromosome segregation ATPase